LPSSGREPIETGGWDSTLRFPRDGIYLFLTFLSRPPPLTRNIVLSACVFEPDQRWAFDAGCDVFLPKPCLPEHLVRELQRLLTPGAQGQRPPARVPGKKRHRRAS
jgi:hypothetical protein